MPSKPNRVWVVTCVLGLLGIAANFLRLNIFTGAPLLFGGVFYLIAALLYGPLLGTLAAFIALVPALVGGHPETACLLILEAAAVGWLARRRMQPMLADLIYWLAIGAPLAALLYFVVLSYPSPSDWVMVVKYPV